MARKKKDKPAKENLIASPMEVRHHYDLLQHGKRDVATAAGDMSELWKAAKDAGIHKAAMALCLKLMNMEETKRDDFLRACQQYFEDLGIRISPNLLDAAGATPQNIFPTAPASPTMQ